MDFLMHLLYSSPLTFPTIVLRLVLSTLLSGIIGFERGLRGRAAGLRTHILVGIGATLLVMTGVYGVENLGYAADPMRLAAQVVSGIGFLGAGTILVRGKSMVMGLTTAAGLWSTAAIGIAIGVGFYGGAVITAVIAFCTFVFLTTFERGGTYGKFNFRVYIECCDADHLQSLINHLTSEEFNLRELEISPARSGLSGHIGIEGTFLMQHNGNKQKRIDRIAALEAVFIAIESV